MERGEPVAAAVVEGTASADPPDAEELEVAEELAEVEEPELEDAAGAGRGWVPTRTTSVTGSAPTAWARTSSAMTSPSLRRIRLVAVRTPSRPWVWTRSVPSVRELVFVRVVG